MDELIVDMDDNLTFSDVNENDIYIYDRTDIRVTFIAIYSIVFCFCVFGNLLVIIVVAWSRRLRSTTNLFLAHLAVADLCVGIFCVLQNLSIYLMTSWVFGEFLCKMYQFITSLSYTASIFILMVVSTERYLAILHPMYVKYIVTLWKLRMVILLAWGSSLVYASPKFFLAKTIVNELENGEEETICILPRNLPYYNSEVLDIINLVVLYVIPLAVMSCLYTLIILRLWNTSIKPTRQLTKKRFSTNSRFRFSFGSNYSSDHDSVLPSTSITDAGNSNGNSVTYRIALASSERIVRARRHVVRMLIAVVLTFALCNLPLHARKMWQLHSPQYEGSSVFSSLLTPITFLLTYCNSAINPLLYAFLSRNFQNGLQEVAVFVCTCRQRGNIRRSLR